jgi:hypothetical protein
MYFASQVPECTSESRNPVEVRARRCWRVASRGQGSVGREGVKAPPFYHPLSQSAWGGGDPRGSLPESAVTVCKITRTTPLSTPRDPTSCTAGARRRRLHSDWQIRCSSDRIRLSSVSHGSACGGGALRVCREAFVEDAAAERLPVGLWPCGVYETK